MLLKYFCPDPEGGVTSVYWPSGVTSRATGLQEKLVKHENEKKKRGLRIKRNYGNLEDRASQDEIGLLRTMRKTERKERRRTAMPTLTSSTIRGDEVSGELTASTLLI